MSKTPRADSEGASRPLGDGKPPKPAGREGHSEERIERGGEQSSAEGDRRLLTGPWRAALAALVPLSALGVLVLGWRFAGAEEPGALDSTLGVELADYGEPHERLLWHVSDLGSPPVLPLGVLLLVVAAVRTGRPWPARVLAAVGPAASVLLTELVLKPVVGRTLNGLGPTLPSGHTTTIASLAWVFVLVFVAGAARPWWWRAALVALAAAVVFGVAGSMVALDRHYFTDTVAGALEATAVVGATALLLDGWALSRARRLHATGASGR
jgi:membrane-associated phospholipid phosphatase